jgi:site-specific DNA recombinase
MNQYAAVYVRVSTQHQEQEATIESQVAALRSYAAEHGYEVPAEFYFLDQAVSGAKLMRPGLDRLRDLAAEGAFAVVLCWSPDRLARHSAHQWVLLDELRRVGVSVIFINQPLIGDDPQGQLLLGIQGLFSEYERAMITERMRRGKLYRIRHEQIAHSHAPYGYRYLRVCEPGGGHWQIDPVEAEVVCGIFDWYTGPEHLTLCAIVARLNAPESCAPPRGQHWTSSTVRNILTQPGYTGQAYQNRTHSCSETVGRPKKSGRGLQRTPEHQLRPASEWLPVPVPAILSEDVWQRAAERLATNQQFAARNNKKYCYPLRSLLVCGTCGRTLIGRTSQGSASYSCPAKKDGSPGIPPHRCAIAERLILPLVWDAVSQLLRQPALLADAWQNQEEPTSATPEQADRLQTRLRALDRQWTRILDAFQSELIDKTQLAERKEHLDQARQAVEQRLADLNRLARREQAKQQMLQGFASFCQQIEGALVTPTPEVQQEVLRLLIDHVVVEPDAIVIKHIIPTDDDCRLLSGHRNTRNRRERRERVVARSVPLCAY